MRPYTDTENTWLRDSGAPLNHRIDESWPTPEQVQYHHRNAQIIRSEAVADSVRLMILLIRSSFRKIRSLPAKIRSHTIKPGATA